METLSLLGNGFLVLLQPANLAVIAAGVVLGMVVALLPGLTLLMGVVLLLPFTYKLDVTPAVILLTTMYVAGTYGGAFTSILFRIPGEPMDVPLLWDGYRMAQAGQPARALGWTLVAALFGGLLSATVMVTFAQPIAKVALTFSTAEYFAIVFFGLMSVVSLAGTSVLNALISLFLGLLIATVGTDPIYGAERFAFGVPVLVDGIEYLIVMVGAYGLGEVFTRLETGFSTPRPEGPGSVGTRLPSLNELLGVKVTLLRSTLIGVVVGLVPGAGATISSFVSYGAEGHYGKRNKQLGSGIPEGIVAPQAAATASVGGALIPLITMGIPGSGATAIILAAFLLHGMQPGPQAFATSAHIIYPVFASVFVGVVGMCVLGYFAIRPLVKVLELPEALVSSFVVLFCFIGTLAARNNTNDLYLIVAFGTLGYLFEKYRFPIAPMVLGAILGPLAETSFMATMASYQGDWTIFLTRPISGTLFLMSAFALAYPYYRHFRSRRLQRLAGKG